VSVCVCVCARECVCVRVRVEGGECACESLCAFVRIAIYLCLDCCVSKMGVHVCTRRKEFYVYVYVRV